MNIPKTNLRMKCRTVLFVLQKQQNIVKNAIPIIVAKLANWKIGHSIRLNAFRNYIYIYIYLKLIYL